MITRRPLLRGIARPRPAVLLLALSLAVRFAGPAAADDSSPPGVEPRVPAGKCLSAGGLLLTSEAEGRDWFPLDAGDDVFSRDRLLVLPGMKATLAPRPHSVELTLWGNLPQQSAFPGLASCVVLHDTRAFDLDFTLRRGRVLVSNRKDKGPARVWVRFPGEGWQLTLTEPGAEVALEIYGRWPRGTSFSRMPRPGEQPTTMLALLVLKGRAELRVPGRQFALAAPPGPAYFHWDSIAGPAEGPQRLEQLPPWAQNRAPASPESQALAGVIHEYRNLLKKKSPDGALRSLLAEAGRTGGKEQARLAREFAVLSLAALGDVLRVADALADPDHPDVRDTAVVALRHFIGQGAGRDQQLYRLLINGLNYKPAQAETVLQLLHSPFAPDQPETYETLIAYLRHGKPAVRELAYWHLYRLVPAGRKIPYDPAGPKAERERGWAEWDKLIPSGQLPPRANR